MSLDVYLKVKNSNINKNHGSGIFIRDNGETREISREEWNIQFPNTEPVMVKSSENNDDDDEVYSANITHNLGEMAKMAGIYQYLWRPEELNLKIADQLINALTAGLSLLKSKPEYFKQFNPVNGWGSYEGLIQFVENYLRACMEYPQAEISTWR
jgi:hypothetical protein